MACFDQFHGAEAAVSFAKETRQVGVSAVGVSSRLKVVKLAILGELLVAGMKS